MAPHRGPSPPRSPAPGRQWFDTDSRTLFEWRDGQGWIEPEPEPVTFDSEWRGIAALIAGLQAAIEREAYRAAVRARVFKGLAEMCGAAGFASPPPAEREFTPPPPPKRDPAQDHPILAIHASRPRGRGPFARRERAPAPEPQWSPEFQAQLDKVAAGAGIVEVIPIRRVEPLHTLGGVAETGI